jgi:hypothetical protein
MSPNNEKAAAFGSRGLPELDLLVSTVDRENKLASAQAQASKPGGKRSRDKGARRERQLQRYLQDDGFAAEKVSGMYKVGPDLTMPLLGVDRDIELKSRDTGFKQIRDWLVDRFAVVVWVDSEEPLVCLRLRDAVEIARVAERVRK